jgi:hypothetical protein
MENRSAWPNLGNLGRSRVRAAALWMRRLSWPSKTAYISLRYAPFAQALSSASLTRIQPARHAIVDLQEE